MALNQTNKLVWIVNTIYKARKITFEELNRRWMDNVDLSGGEEMLKRTFHKWKWNIFDTFGLMIECEKTAPYRYYIENVDDMKSDGIENWLLSTYSVSNALIESKSIKDRIILEDVPSGREYLEPILEAMKINRFIHITYYNYWRDDLREHYLMPLCMKLFRQRWYMVGRQCLQETTQSIASTVSVVSVSLVIHLNTPRTLILRNTLMVALESLPLQIAILKK